MIGKLTMNRRRNVINGQRVCYPNSMAMTFRWVPALVLAVVCGGGGGIVDAADNLVFPHISRINSKYYIFYNIATTPMQARKFCRDTGGAQIDFKYQPNYDTDTNLAIFSFLKQSMRHNSYVWMHGKCCEQRCMTEVFDANSNAFELDNRIF